MNFQERFAEGKGFIKVRLNAYSKKRLLIMMKCSAILRLQKNLNQLSHHFRILELSDTMLSTRQIFQSLRIYSRKFHLSLYSTKDSICEILIQFLNFIRSDYFDPQISLQQETCIHSTPAYFWRREWTLGIKQLLESGRNLNSIDRE